MGYRFGIGFDGIQVWDWVLWDIGLGLGFMGYGLGIGFWRYRFGIGFMGYGFGIGFMGYRFGTWFYMHLLPRIYGP